MTRGVRTGLLTLLAVAATGTALVAGAFAYLRSPSGSEWILARAKKWVREQGGGELEYARGSVNPFAGVHFEKLRFKQASSTRHLEVTIQRLDLEYRIAWFSRRLDVHQFKVEKPVIIYREREKGLPIPPALSGEADEANVDSEGGLIRKEDRLARARRLVLNPPLQVSVPELSIMDLDLEWQLKSQSSSGDMLDARVKGLDFKSKLEWVSGRFLSQADLQLGAPVPLVWGVVSKDSTRWEARATLWGSASWNAAIGRQGEPWIYEVHPADLKFEARDLSFVSSGPRGVIQARLPSLKLDVAAKLLAHTRELWVAESSAFQETGVSGNLTAGKLTIEQGPLGKKSRRTVIASQGLKLTSELKEDLGLALRWEAHGISSPELLSRIVNASAQCNATAARDLRRLEAQGRIELGGIPLLKSELLAQLAPPQEGGGMVANGKLASSLDSRLAKLMPRAAALAQTGPVAVTLGFDVRSGGNPKTVLEAAMGMSRVPVREKFELRTVQAPGGRPEIRFEPMSLTVGLERAPGPGRNSFRIRGSVPSLVTPNLKSAASLQLTSGGEWDGEADGSRRLKANVDLQFNHADFGTWSITANSQASGKGQGFEEKGTATFTQVSATPAVPFIFSKPIALAHRYTIKRALAEGELSAQLPHLRIRGLGQVENTLFSARFGTPEDTAGESTDDQELALEAKLTQGEFELEEGVGGGLGKQLPKLPGLSLSTRARLSEGNQLELESLDAHFGGGLIRLEAEAIGKIKSRDLELSGLLNLDVPKNFPPIAGQKLQGKMELPWTLSVIGGREVGLEGTLKLREFSAMGPEGGLSGVTGSVPLSERLLIEGGHVKFARLITRNPFERVDFERVRPLLEGAEPLRIEAIHWEEKIHGPLIGFLSVEQNMLLAQQANLSLGSGRVYGEIFLDAYPANLQFGLLSRVTGLDLGEVLPRRFLDRVPSGNRKVSGRTGLVVDLNRRTLSGRIDVTEIGAPQLVMMVNVLDPSFQNEKMNQLRSRLGVVSPTFVAISIEKGYADMTVGLSLLGNWSARGVATSPWISAFTAALAKKSQAGPISK